ncbi:glycosyltransferase family 2 protein [Comamonas kerstersii]|uniref:glycosyltransferase family 2 protein n=1 Tax=Comamonas kerstersii TaxID=225992 RepID=UPI00266C0C87|nr:glycosyltransferase family 2 protein [Comamonas kerstersii]
MILITMAGLSSRFFKAGYTVPKYALQIGGCSMFEWAIKTFEKYYASEFFVFVVRQDGFSQEFVVNAANRLGINNYQIFCLDKETRGQAETAYIYLKEYSEDFPVLIFNIDTIRFNYIKPLFINECDGYLEVFHGDGEHWSFVEPGPDQTVIRTTEKEKISDLCSDGLYYFRSRLQFCSIFEQAIAADDKVKGEFYIAPLYNRLIDAGGVVKYELIGPEQIDFCGTPDEYEALLKKKALA